MSRRTVILSAVATVAVAAAVITSLAITQPGQVSKAQAGDLVVANMDALATDGLAHKDVTTVAVTSRNDIYDVVDTFDAAARNVDGQVVWAEVWPPNRDGLAGMVRVDMPVEQFRTLLNTAESHLTFGAGEADRVRAGLPDATTGVARLQVDVLVERDDQHVMLTLLVAALATASGLLWWLTRRDGPDQL